MLMILRIRAWSLKHLIISIAFPSSRGDCGELALHASEGANISSIVSSPHVGIDHFQILRIGQNILRQLCQLTPAPFASSFTMLPNGLVQLFSENILLVPDTLDQHKL